MTDLEESLDLVVIIASAFGAVTGGLSLLGLLIVVGIYKERVDRHERLLNILVDESIVQAWRSGIVQRGSFKTKAETVSDFPEAMREACERAAKQVKGKNPAPSYAALSDLLLKKLDQRVFAEAAIEAGVTPMELFGALVTYTAELAGA